MDKVKRVVIVTASYVGFMVAYLVGILAWVAALPLGYCVYMANESRRFTAIGSLLFMLLGLPFAVLVWALAKVFYLLWHLAGPWVDFDRKMREKLRARPGFWRRVIRILMWFRPEWVERAVRPLRDVFDELFAKKPAAEASASTPTSGR